MQDVFITESLPGGNRVYNSAMQPGGRPTKRKRTPLGERIVAARESVGVSQAQLASKLGTSQPAIAYWERNATNLRSDVLEKIATALGVSVDSLLGKDVATSRQNGPVGKVRQTFEEVSKLPRRQQQQIIKVVGALLSQAKADTQSSS